MQRDPLEWLECNFIRPSVPSLLLLPHFYDCHMIPSSHQMIFALGPILAIMAEKLPTPSIGCATLPHSYWPESSALGNAADSVFIWVPNPGWVPGFLEKNGLGFLNLQTRVPWVFVFFIFHSMNLGKKCVICIKIDNRN